MTLARHVARCQARRSGDLTRCSSRCNTPNFRTTVPKTQAESGGQVPAEQQTTVFSYRREDMTAPRAKQVAKLCRTDLIKAEVQLVRRGGENNLHSHPHRDEVFYVLSGRVRFY